MTDRQIINSDLAEVTVFPARPVGPTPLSILQIAVEKGVDPAQLEKLMELQERWERNRAAEAFAEAITGFQAECPVVTKWRETAKTANFEGYKFASYDDVMHQAAPLLAKHKIAVSFRTEQAEHSLKVICRLRVGIHTEDHEYTTPIPAMKVNDTQRFGAALKYAQRYALCAALNIVTTDQDDDAASMIQCIDESQVAELNRLLEENKRSLPSFLKWSGEAAGHPVESLDKLPLAVYAKALDILTRKARKV